LPPPLPALPACRPPLPPKTRGAAGRSSLRASERDGNSATVSHHSLPAYRQPGLLCTSRNFAQSSKFLGKK
jgi:hypothetical protein